jgi:osmotically-inducible protein OsmY
LNRAAGNFGANANLNGAANSFGGQGGRAQNRVVRPRQRIAFEYSAPQGTQITSSLGKQLKNIVSRRPALANVEIDSQGGEVVLRGNVDTSEQARLAEALVRLEPGVRAIRNELVIANSDSESADSQ